MINILETSPKDNLQKQKSSSHYSNRDNENKLKCSICDEVGHSQTNGPNKSKFVQYFACKNFVEMNPSQRFKELFTKGLCFQCLYPGAKNSEGKHAEGTCQGDYVCKHESHKKHKRKKHVLVCQEHCASEENVKLFEEYKSKFITPQRTVQEFSKNIKLAFVSSYFPPHNQIPSSTQLTMMLLKRVVFTYFSKFKLIINHSQYSLTLDVVTLFLATRL